MRIQVGRPSSSTKINGKEKWDNEEGRQIGVKFWVRYFCCLSIACALQGISPCRPDTLNGPDLLLVLVVGGVVACCLGFIFQETALRLSTQINMAEELSG